jgi:type I restriction enzyme, S subunit
MSFEWPEGWEQKPLEALCERVSVGHVGETSSFFVENEGIPLLRSQNVRPNKVELSDIKFITQDFHSKSKKSQLRGGDLLIVRVGQNRGDCAVLPHGLGEINCANIVFARPDPSYSDFLGAYFNTPNGNEALLSLSSGSAQLVLNTKSVAKIQVPVPPANEALAIGALSRTFDDRISLLRETNTTLEAIAQALFKSWFVDFDPVRVKQQGNAPQGMDAATAALFPDSFEESELGEVPKGWRVGTLGDLSDLNPESWTARNHPETIAYIDLANIKDNEIGSIADFPFDEAPSRARRVLRSGDTIVGTVRPGNRSFAFIHEPVSNLTASTGFAVLRPIVVENTEFVYLKATQDTSIEHLAHVADGGAYPAVRPDVVSGLQCFVPPSEVMTSFHGVTEPLLTQVCANQKQAQTLATLRDTLLPRLISGQLRLPA